jgi:hypothetical protein
MITIKLSNEQVETLEIALSEMFKSDSWTWNVKSSDVDRIADRAEYILKLISKEKQKSK